LCIILYCTTMGSYPLFAHKKYTTNGKKMQEENVVLRFRTGFPKALLLYRKYEIQE